VDALNFDEALDGYRIALDQIRAADVLILNKCDLVDDSRLQILQHRLCELKPTAPVITATRGDVNPALILDVEETVAEGKECHRQPLAGRQENASRYTHVHDRLWFRSIKFSGKLDRGKFLKAVESIPPSIFRAKGIIETSNPPQTMLFQYVAGRYELSALPQTHTSDRFLTLIGKSDDAVGFDRAEQLLRAAET
jgi:G3E family GTPase